jgi:murein L,D-transpeptidase YafK
MTAKLFGYLSILLFLTLTVYYLYPERKLPANTKIDRIEVYKSKRQLLAYSEGQLLKTYRISVGGNPVGDKQYEGDKKTPEGIYFINGKNPNSGYWKNLGVSYPNRQDVIDAKNLGRPAGGLIKIHGLRNGLGFIGKFHRWFDWTGGCMALTNEDVDELYESVAVGTVIHIMP